MVWEGEGGRGGGRAWRGRRGGEAGGRGVGGEQGGRACATATLARPAISHRWMAFAVAVGVCTLPNSVVSAITSSCGPAPAGQAPQAHERRKQMRALYVYSDYTSGLLKAMKIAMVSSMPGSAD